MDFPTSTFCPKKSLTFSMNTVYIKINYFKGDLSEENDQG